MEDRFKFRVWSKKYNKFIEDNSYPMGSDYQLIITQSGTLIKLGLGDFEDDCEDIYSWATFNNYEQDCIVMQCTGLKDKNGKLIFEGDIVKFKTELFGKPKQIIWDECHYRLKNTFITLCNMEIKQFGLEVIGNIYNNPELLESEGE